jgi:periplasmic copper chaperone A
MRAAAAAWPAILHELTRTHRLSFTRISIMNRLLLAAAFGAASLALSVPAFAHATFERPEAQQNSTWKGVLRVPHGCNGQATNTVRVAIPEGVINVKPMPKAGWKLDTVSGEYARSYTLFGREVRSGVKEIVWSGGDLADAHYDEFVFTARMTETLAEGPLYVPTVQECASAQARWTEIPAAGQDAHALKSPAPAVIIRAQHAHGGHGAPAAAQTQGGAVVRAGALTIEAPWTRATPQGARVAGGYMRITNTGAQPDRLTGGSFPLAGRFEVHEMATTNGVMTMRELAQGLVIQPGQTVELRPGGLHVMFMELREPLREGRPVKGTLVFEKAGTVEIEYRVAPVGARSAGGHAHH